MWCWSLFYLSLSLCLAAVAPWHERFFSSCGGPQWVHSYAALYHEPHSRVLVLDMNLQGCAGLGNMFILVYKAFLMAYISNRTFVMRDAPRCPLGHYFHSPFFHWHTNATFPNASVAAPSHGPSTQQPAAKRQWYAAQKERFKRAPLAQLFPDPVMVAGLELHSKTPYMLLDNPSIPEATRASPLLHPNRSSLLFGCIHNLLFAPSEGLRWEVDRYLEDLIPDGVAVHIRRGDASMLSGTQSDHREPPNMDCADAAVGNRTIFLATDSLKQLELWEQRYRDRVLFHPGKPKHTAYSNDFDEEAMLKVLVDFQVLCHSPMRCLTEGSTFSTTVHYCALCNNSWAINTRHCGLYAGQFV
eukprot:GGOE01017866.1.p1 GENE.GGOE01017866.1~~GGOE01017866.1.p1  ORF type:complete len:357 (+),score=78.01 GGOE01017866.1:20-1090(+)